MNDHHFGSEDDFRINIFIKTLDIVINQVDNRFKGLHEVSNLFAFMVPTKLAEMEEPEILKSAEVLQLKL